VPPQATAEVPELVVRAAALNHLGEQQEIHRFKAAPGHISLSPDGGYLLYAGCDPCDERRLYTPMIFDVNSGKITAAAEPTQGSSMPRRITWSGQGFWIDPLVHFGIDGRLDANVQLRQALTPQGWDLVAAEVSPDGRLVVAALEQAGASASAVDLVVASRDGKIISRMPAALPAVRYNRGMAVMFAWSPDSRKLVLCGEHCWLADIGQPEKDAWRQLPDRAVPRDVQWSPDGKHLLIPGMGIVNLDGTVEVPVAGEATWNPAGTAVVTEGRVSEYRLDGSHVDYGDIGSQVILGWLPDGRIVLLGG
jgi:hypothetical protein